MQGREEFAHDDGEVHQLSKANGMHLEKRTPIFSQFQASMGAIRTP